MTKERLYHEIPNDDYRQMLDVFFSQNVVTPKGENRHPYADVLYEWQWCVIMDDGTARIYGFHTEDNINDLFKDREKYKIKGTKRERKCTY